MLTFCSVVIILLQLALAVLIIKMGYELEEARLRAGEAESREAALLRQRHTMELMVKNAQKIARDLTIINEGREGVITQDIAHHLPGPGAAAAGPAGDGA